MERAVPVGLQPHQADAAPPAAVHACGYQLPAGPGPLRIRRDGQRPDPGERAPCHREQRPCHPVWILLPHGNEAPVRIRGKPHGGQQRRDRRPVRLRVRTLCLQPPERRVRHRQGARQVIGSHRPDHAHGSFLPLIPVVPAPPGSHHRPSCARPGHRRACLAGYKYWSLQYLLVETSSSTSQVQPELAPGTAEVLQAATRVLAGVALRSLDVLDGAVTLPQFRMLAVLADLGRARSAQVARALGLDASTVTRLADRLAAAGHIARGREPGHRSVVTLELTATGQHLVSQAAAWREQELARILRQLPPAGRRQVTTALRQLVEAAGEGYGTISRGLVPV